MIVHSSFLFVISTPVKPLVAPVTMFAFEMSKLIGVVALIRLLMMLCSVSFEIWFVVEPPLIATVAPRLKLFWAKVMLFGFVVGRVIEL